MRNYSTISPRIWTGKTGRALRGDMEAQLVALYLITSPHATMTGVFHCPVIYIAHAGISIEGASKGLRRLSEEGFCSFDEEIDLVWIHEMARFQVGAALKAGDKRISAVNKGFESMPKCLITQSFFERYRSAFHLRVRPDLGDFVRGINGASKPLRSQDREHQQEHEQEQEQEQGQGQGQQIHNQEKKPPRVNGRDSAWAVSNPGPDDWQGDDR